MACKSMFSKVLQFPGGHFFDLNSVEIVKRLTVGVKVMAVVVGSGRIRTSVSGKVGRSVGVDGIDTDCGAKVGDQSVGGSEETEPRRHNNPDPVWRHGDDWLDRHGGRRLE